MEVEENPNQRLDAQQKFNSIAISFHFMMLFNTFEQHFFYNITLQIMVLLLQTKGNPICFYFI